MPGSVRENWHEDRSLLDAFRRGERAALSQIYYAHVDDVAVVVRTGFTLKEQGIHVPGTGTGDTERELVQEVFFRAFEESARLAYDGLRPYGPYLGRIARNLLIDRQRQRQRQLSKQVDSEAIDGCPAASPARAHEEELHWNRLSAVTKEYLATLDEQTRRLVRLRFEEELSQDEAASQLGLSRRKVRTLEEHVQTGLRRFLKRRDLWRDASGDASTAASMGSAFGVSARAGDAGRLSE